MTSAAHEIRPGCFAVINGITYQVNFSHRDSTMSVLLDANDSSGTWMPDLAYRPAYEMMPMTAASRLFGVRTFAKWGDVGVRIVQADHRLGKATAFYVPTDLVVSGPKDWPAPRRSSVPPRDGMSTLKSHGSDPDDEFAGDVPFDQLTDIRQTEVELPRGEDGDLRTRPGLFI